MSKILQVKQLEKYYGKNGVLTKALDDVTFSVERGEFVSIMGPSGSGKTTLLNCIATFDRMSAGDILIEGASLANMSASQAETFRRDQLGFVFQEFQLLTTLTAFENIALALTIQGVKEPNVTKRIMTIAERLDIVGILDKFPSQLSGGQKQRVAAARALVTNPVLILADEPTGALDSKSANQLLETLKYTHEQDQTAILLVTHDALAASYSDRVIFIKDGQFFNELYRGKENRNEFFQRIMEILIVLGGQNG